MFLTIDQLRELTGKQRARAQVRVLTELGIKHGVRPDGSLVVMDAAVDAVLGPGSASKLARKTQPNLALVS
jgi:hypothetical protein